MRRIFDADERYDELRGWLAEQWRGRRGRVDARGARDLRRARARRRRRRSLLESEPFRALLEAEPPLRVGSLIDRLRGGAAGGAGGVELVQDDARSAAASSSVGGDGAWVEGFLGGTAFSCPSRGARD